MPVSDPDKPKDAAHRLRQLGELVGSGQCKVDYLPEAYTPVLIHCEGFSCVAYLDETGLWRGRYTNELISGRVIAWEEI